MRDIVLAVRGLSRDRWHAISSILVVALAVALTVTVVAIGDGVLFKPLPYERPDELFVVTRGTARALGLDGSASRRELKAWIESESGARFAEWASAPAMWGVAEGQPLRACRVGADLLDVLGVRLVAGGFRDSDLDWYRTYTSSGDRRPPVLISHRTWTRLLSGEPEVLGRAVTLDRFESTAYGFRVAGILPESFVFPFPDGAWTPSLLIPTLDAPPDQEGQRSIHVLIRVPDAASAPAVAKRLSAVSRRFGEADAVVLTPLAELLGRPERAELTRILAGAAALLCLALVNVAGVASVRALQRGRDHAVKRALGAGFSRIAREVGAEALVLVVIGSTLALVASPWLIAWTARLLPEDMMLLKTPSLDLRVLVAAAILAASAVVVIALVVARAATRVGETTPLFSLGRPSVTRSRRFGRAVLAVQMVIGTMLLVAASLFGASIRDVLRTDAGFDVDRVAVLHAVPVNVPDVTGVMAQMEDLRHLVWQIGGVSAAAFAEVDFGASSRTWAAHLAPVGWSAEHDVATVQVEHHYFGALGLRLVNGRWPAPDEWAGRQPVALVSETAAHRFWGRPDVVGEAMTGSRPERREPPVTVIGVVSDVSYQGFDRSPTGDVYVPFGLVRDALPAIILVADGNAGTTLARVSAAVRLDGRFRIASESTARAALSQSSRPLALRAWLFGSFGVTALGVLVVGTLAVSAAATLGRTREMGIRIALGAKPASIVRLSMLDYLSPAIFGLAFGSVVAVLIVPVFRAQLTGIGPFDPASWLFAVVILVASTAAAAAGPALRASRSDPAVVLRRE